MNKVISLVLLAAGLVLVVYGFEATHSVGSDFSRLFTGSPTDKSIWLLLAGLVLTALGGSGLIRGAKPV